MVELTELNKVTNRVAEVRLCADGEVEGSRTSPETILHWVSGLVGSQETISAFACTE